MRERVRRPLALFGMAMLLLIFGACQPISTPEQSVSIPDHTLDDPSEVPGTGVELVGRWIDGALVGAFEDIAQLTYGEFGEPEAMERLAGQIHERALAALGEPRVTVTDRGTDGTQTYTCFRIEYGNGADVGMILTRTWPDLGERVWESRSTGPCDLDPETVERVVPTWINQTGLASTVKTWQERLPHVCAQAGLETPIFDDILVDFATGYITEDTAAGFGQGASADPVEAADALWFMAVEVCPELFPADAGPPSFR